METAINENCNGNGVAWNYTKAAELHSKAAKQGFALAKKQLEKLIKKGGTDIMCRLCRKGVLKFYCMICPPPGAYGKRG